MTGYFPPWENEICLNLLNKYGQPLKENHRAVMAFQQEFNYRRRSGRTPTSSMGARRRTRLDPGAENQKHGVPGTVEASGGKWVGFQGRLGLE